MLLFYVPLALVVIPFWGFLIAWNLWIYATVSAAGIVFAIPTDIGYMIRSQRRVGAGQQGCDDSDHGRGCAQNYAGGRVWTWAWENSSQYGQHHDPDRVCDPAGPARLGAAARIHPQLPPVPLERSSTELAQPGGIRPSVCGRPEWIRICRDSGRRVTESGENIGRSVMLSAPVIALMFILGTSSVQTFVGNWPINLIGPIPQTFRLALGTEG
jgi:glutamate:GABA antiporter